MPTFKPSIKRKVIDDKHYYYVEDESGKERFFPSVTTILGETLPTPPALKIWLGEVGNEKAQAKLEAAGDRGTKIHGACEQLLQGSPVYLKQNFPAKEDKKAITGFINWCNDYSPRVADMGDIERQIASEFGYAGTLDLFCYIKNDQGVEEPWIIDFKTSAGVYDSHKLQITAYQQAFYEMTDIAAKTGILHLNPRVKKGYSFHTEMEIGGKKVKVDDFLKVFEVYKMLNGGQVKEPRLVDAFPDVVTLYEQVI